MFFGDDEDEDEKYDTEQAVKAGAVCALCPLRHECLADALRTNEQFGVRGGMTPSQRQQIKGRI